MAHPVSKVRVSTTVRESPYMTQPLEMRAYDIREFTVDLGNAIAEGDSIDSVTSVDALARLRSGDDDDAVDSDVTVDDIDVSGDEVTFVVSGTTQGGEYDLRIRCALSGSPTQRIEVMVPLDVGD